MPLRSRQHAKDRPRLCPGTTSAAGSIIGRRLGSLSAMQFSRALIRDDRGNLHPHDRNPICCESGCQLASAHPPHCTLYRLHRAILPRRLDHAAQGPVFRCESCPLRALCLSRWRRGYVRVQNSAGNVWTSNQLCKLKMQHPSSRRKHGIAAQIMRQSV